MENQIEFIIPKGYKKSAKSTDEKLIFELADEAPDIKEEARRFLIDIFNKMKVRVELDNPGNVYYDLDGVGTVFEQDFENERLWVSYKYIWSVFEKRFSWEYDDIQVLIKSMVEETLNWRGLTPLANLRTQPFGWKRP